MNNEPSAFTEEEKIMFGEDRSLRGRRLIKALKKKDTAPLVEILVARGYESLSGVFLLKARQTGHYLVRGNFDEVMRALSYLLYVPQGPAKQITALLFGYANYEEMLKAWEMKMAISLDSEKIIDLTLPA